MLSAQLTVWGRYAAALNTNWFNPSTAPVLLQVRGYF